MNMTEKTTLEFYIVIDKAKKKASPIRVKELRLTRPNIESTQAAVKINLTIPNDIIEKQIPEIDVETDKEVITEDIKIEGFHLE